MNILKAISASFAKLWRWIRETAWVQPLLIVGAIFAVIFSIPKFTTWFSAMGAGASNNYYSSYKLTLEGEGRKTEENGKVTYYDTLADKVTRGLAEWSFVSNTTYPTYEAFVDAMKASDTNPLQYGEKYFLAYVGRDCSPCDTAQGGYEALEAKWGSLFVPSDGRDFAIKTIFSDDTSSNDDDFDLEVLKKPFVRYLNKWNAGEGGADFFSLAGARLEDTPYASNANIAESYYTHITEADNEAFDVPTILLIDWSKEAWELGRPGVSEACFGVKGDKDYDRADFLLDMWNHTDSIEAGKDTGDTTNIFVEEYVA
ncbi:MAG: hypothetical protein HUJ60_05960 [Bacilli bacterium]|nr:hypothetical protein [Bacilli bacterium]